MGSGARVRFAPSPTGHLHVGNARTALFNWLHARGTGGVMVLRIEDTDAERSTTEAERMIYEDLRWLGLDWDEGPDRGGPFGPYRQSQRRRIYREHAERLLRSGAAYRCFCTVERLRRERESQRRAGLAPRYPGTCRSVTRRESDTRSLRESFVLRFQVRARTVVVDDLLRGRVEFPGDQIGDPVILRAEGGPTYNFAVVVDDAAMRITDVIRGEDHLSNTPLQLLLYRALGADPPRFAHLPLVVGTDGAPLSKRHGASSVADLRARGLLPEAVVNYLALLGWAHPEERECLSLQEITRVFQLARVRRSAGMFDLTKLAWLNGQHLRRVEPDELLRHCWDTLVKEGCIDARADPATRDWAGRALKVFSGQMETFQDVAPVMDGLFRFERRLSKDESIAILDRLAREPGARDVVVAFARETEKRRPPLLLSREEFRETLALVRAALGVKGRALFHPIRVAVTGAESGPDLDRLVPLIDEGHRLALPAPLLSCVERARLVADRLGAGR